MYASTLKLCGQSNDCAKEEDDLWTQVISHCACTGEAIIVGFGNPHVFTALEGVYKNSSFSASTIMLLQILS